MATRHCARTPAGSSSSSSLNAPAGRFTADGCDRAPLPDLPAALPCPFCDRTDDIMISESADASAKEPWYRANCGICGVDAPGQDTLLGAAQEWNKRAAPSLSRAKSRNPMIITEKELRKQVNRLDCARSAVFVTSQALDNGETDLELQSATALKHAYRTMDFVYDTLQRLRIEVGKAERDQQGASQSRRVAEFLHAPVMSDESDDRTEGQKLYDDVAEIEGQLKSLMDEIPYESLGDLPETHPTAQAFLNSEVHLQDAVAELRKVRDAELPRSEPLTGGES